MRESYEKKTQNITKMFLVKNVAKSWIESISLYKIQAPTIQRLSYQHLDGRSVINGRSLAHFRRCCASLRGLVEGQTLLRRVEILQQKTGGFRCMSLFLCFNITYRCSKRWCFPAGFVMFKADIFWRVMKKNNLQQRMRAFVSLKMVWFKISRILSSHLSIFKCCCFCCFVVMSMSLLVWCDPYKVGGPEQMVASGNNQGLGIVSFVSFVNRIFFFTKISLDSFFPSFFHPTKTGNLVKRPCKIGPTYHHPPPKIKDWEPKI